VTKKSNTIPRLITKFSQPEIKALFRLASPFLKVAGLEIRRAPKTLPELARILIVIPRTVGTAVERNLLRRRLKNIFYQEKLYQHKFDIVVLTRPGAIQYSFDELTQFLEAACKAHQ
jgi:ribonuclease P protein component